MKVEDADITNGVSLTVKDGTVEESDGVTANELFTVGANSTMTVENLKITAGEHFGVELAAEKANLIVDSASRLGKVKLAKDTFITVNTEFPAHAVKGVTATLYPAEFAVGKKVIQMPLAFIESYRHTIRTWFALGDEMDNVDASHWFITTQGQLAKKVKAVIPAEVNNGSGPLTEVDVAVGTKLNNVNIYNRYTR